MKITRKGRWKVEDFSQHNELPEAFENAANKSKELSRSITITPPSYEVDNVEIFEGIPQGSVGLSYGTPTNEIFFWTANSWSLGQTPSDLTYGDFSGKGRYKAFEQPTIVTHAKMPSGKALRYKILGDVRGTDISFSGSTMSSTVTDLSNYVNGHVITISGSANNNGSWTVSGTPSATSLTITSTFTTESAGADVRIVGNYTSAGYGSHTSQLDALTTTSSGMPTANLYGQKIYMCAFMQFTHHSGSGFPHPSTNEDIFQVALDAYDFNKQFEWRMYTGHGITPDVTQRLLMNIGHIPWCRPDYSNYTNAAISANTFTQSLSLLAGDNFPPEDWFAANQGGLSCSNWPEFNYDRVHSIVTAMTPKSDGTGTIETWFNNVKVAEYLNYTTCIQTTFILDQFLMNGTINQDGYNAPLHYIDYDYILLTTDVNDVIDCGFFQDPEA